MTATERTELLANAIRAASYYMGQGRLRDWRHTLDRLANYANMVSEGRKMKWDYAAKLQEYGLQVLVEGWREETSNGEG